uniref:ribosomal protein S7 n=1 Tax=Leontynka pallida TaxID=2912034 RepID=UPI0020286784|nr:ribosomal protein S7 [Leontynka pallida]UPQ43847.1 ribosomal protein S7 [Leontynka pallida]
MSRRPFKKIHVLLTDPVYNNMNVQMLVNRVLKNGKKSIAYRIVYSALKEIGEQMKKDPIQVFETAIDNVTPRVEIQPRRRAGAVQLVPRVARVGSKTTVIAIRWILEGCHKRSGQPMPQRLKNEIIDCYNGTGYSMKKREELHKAAINNAMFARNPQLIINSIN